MNASLSAEFATFLARSRAVRFGDFTLKNKAKSNIFFNFGDLCGGRELSELGAFFARTIIDQGLQSSDALFGPAYKGINLALACSVALWRDHGIDIPVAYNRKEAKAHGEGGLIVGADLSKAKNVIVLDDVITDGATKVEVIEMLTAFPGLTVAAMIVGVDRQDTNNEGRPYLDILAEQTGVKVVAMTTRAAVLAHKAA